MRNWLRFFAGTPGRALGTAVGLGILAILETVSPGAIQTALIAVGTAILGAVLGLLEKFLAPIAVAVLPLVFVGIGIRVMLKGFSGGRKRR